MVKPKALLVAVLTLLGAAGLGVGAFLLVDKPGPRYPEISAYSHGHLVRIGPYVYCDVLDLDDCDMPATQGELPVNPRDVVQLSVPAEIARARWRLTEVYQDGELFTEFRPNSHLAATIPTVDPRYGRLTGIVVQPLTLVRFADGELGKAPHAEWSVATVWE